VTYLHLPDLGGWRCAGSESPNGAWDNPFTDAPTMRWARRSPTRSSNLRKLGGEQPTAMMCSEALSWPTSAG
jgi:hypothetical protein